MKNDTGDSNFLIKLDIDLLINWILDWINLIAFGVNSQLETNLNELYQNKLN